MTVSEDRRTQTERLNLLDREAPVLELPIDHPRPGQLSSDVALRTVALPETLVERLKALDIGDNKALAPVLLAAFQVLLYRYSGQEEIWIGSPIADGSDAWRVVRADLSDVAGAPPSFRALFLETSRALVGTAVDPLPVSESRVQPVFQAGWVHRAAVPAGGACLSHWTGLEIALLLDETGSPPSASFIYSTDLFKSTTISRMAGHYQTLLSGIVADPDRSIALLPLLTPAERHRIVVEWNETRTDYPREACIQQLFEAQVAHNPEAVAIVFAGQCVTYGGLNRRANELAHHLRSLGVGPDTLVGICVERSIEMVAGILGILKAGGAYVPLDPNYPEERLAFMADDAGLSVILTQEKWLERLPACQAERVCIDTDWRQLARHSTENPVCSAMAEHLAYVMYTSGSTGTPKGASITHRSVVRLVKETHYARLTASEVFLQYAPISFDAATLELWGSLLNGGVLVVSPPHNLSLSELGEIVREHGVTILWLTAGLFHLMVDECLEDLRPVRQLLSGGDVLSVPHVKRVLAALEGCTLINGYGPTENTTFTCCYPMRSVEQVGASVPIGRPIANTSVYILDRHLQPVPVGVPGELYTGGDGLARDYHNRPELTAEKFIRNPFGEGRLYRTGDRVRYLPDGNIEFLGRIDNQVKVRGFRIELGEIEAVLEQHPAVQHAVVLALTDPKGDKRLAAYLTLSPEVAGENDAREHVALWQALYEETYRQTPPPDDPTFHAAWWTSSYTGQPIAAAEMREWVDRAVSLILALQPQRALEIGCGTGMLLARVAPHCASYVGIDFSPTALDHIRSMKQTVAGLDHIRLLERTADDLADLPAQSFDTIVINSVTQHFPDLDYLLRVLKGAVRLTRPGGHILIGDVSNLALLETLHSSVQCYRATDTVTSAQLRQRIRQQVAQERDLQIDPAFFLAFKEQSPELRQVQVIPKRGRYDNQLSRFRYEAILRVGEPAHGTHDEALEVRDLAWIDWQRERLTPADIQRILSEQRPLTLAIRAISNARLAHDLATMHWLREAAPDATLGRLRAFLTRQPPHGLHPEDLWALAQELPYRLELSWLNAGAHGVYDAVFTEQSLPRRPAHFARSASLLHAPLAKYVNHPQRATKHGHVIRQVREFLEEKLPDHMVPAAFAVLDKLPLSPNGKINRRALAQLGLEEQSLAKTTFVQSHDPVEKMLAEVWADVLSLKHIGLEDDFFALGGNSLKAMALMNRLQRRFNRSFGPVALFHAPTVARFAAYVQEQYPDLAVELTAVSPQGSREEGEI